MHKEGSHFFMHTQTLLFRRLAVAFVSVVLALSTLAAPALAASCNSGQTLLNSNVLTTTTASVTFSSISPTGAGGCTYTNLRIVGQARTDSSTCDSWLRMTVGSISGGAANTLDTGGHYNYVQGNDYGQGYSDNKGYQQTSMSLLTIGCNTRPTGAASSFEIYIPNAFSTNWDKDIISSSNTGYDTNSPAGSAGAQPQWAGGVWAPGCASPCNENAIDIMKFELNTGSFLTGSSFYLWAE